MMNRAENRTVLSTKRMAAAIIGGSMMLAASGSQAKDDDDVKQCSVATLHGLYIFHASGFNIVGGAAQPKASPARSTAPSRT